MQDLAFVQILHSNKGVILKKKKKKKNGQPFEDVGTFTNGCGCYYSEKLLKIMCLNIRFKNLHFVCDIQQ